MLHELIFVAMRLYQSWLDVQNMNFDDDEASELRTWEPIYGF